ATHFLDNVVSANKYVPAVPELEKAAHYARRIGLGIMGLADLMYRQRVRYGNSDGEELAAQVMEFVRYHCMKTSIEMARRRGPFPAIKGSIYDPENLKWKPPTPLTPYQRDFGRPPVDWNEIVQGIRHYGIRNAAQTTVAPTGTIATVAGCEGYGCEPVFALAYIRHVQDGEDELDLQYTSPLFQQALVEAGIDEEARRFIYDEVMRSGTCQNIEAVPDHIRHTFVVANDITPEEHVRMQAAIQRFVDNSISKTNNFPEHATPDDVARAYMLAWELGCKGLTVYVTGTREKVVLETKETLDAKERTDAVAQLIKEMNGHLIKKPRPRKLRGYTYKQATPLGTAYVNVTEDEDGHPFEVFLNVGKGGSDTSAAAEAIGRLISLVLRLPSPRSPEERLGEVIAELSDIGGGRSLGFGPHRVASLPDGVAQALAEHLGQPALPTPPLSSDPGDNGAARFTDDYCPECGQATLVREEGCRKCYSCGFSEC
ncbi:MAG: ribonucleoside-diphosphate reductase, adenosylcobalamin-dependent, partial [Anaerolineae bacterium]